MRVALRSEGKNRAASCTFLREPDPEILLSWKNALPIRSSDQQRDAVEFLESALSKWRLYAARKRTAVTEQQLARLIERDHAIDALSILSLRASWAGVGESLGICQFRRTWRHSIVVDYLAVHPLLLTPKKAISGAGTALLFSLATVANNLRVPRLWLETTDLSANYYSALFGTDRFSDLLIIPTTEFHTVLQSYFGEQNTR